MKLAWISIAAFCACASSPRSAPDAKTGHLRVTVGVDWEGAFLSDDGLAALESVTMAHPSVPITHWICPAYLTKDQVDEKVTARIRAAIRPIDEVALHIHGWHSLAEAAGVDPKFGPSFLHDRNELLEFPDGDTGFEVDLSAYSEDEFRALVRFAAGRLRSAGFTMVPMFRAGAGILEAHNLDALVAEGFRVDSSAIPVQFWRAEHGMPDRIRQRTREVWGELDDFAGPRWLETRHGKLLEIPAPPGFADYSSTDQLTGYIDAGAERLAKSPTEDVYIHLAFHQETAHETSETAPHRFAERIDRSLEHIAQRYGDRTEYELMSRVAVRHGAQLE
jgi:hypothetical protein